MNMIHVTAVLVALASFFAATEQGVAQDARDAFNRLDADQSGTVTWAEAYKVRAEQFIAMDTNMDGIIAADEFEATARPLSAFDFDKDGKLHLAEYLAGHRGIFDRFAEEANGSLSFDEFEAAQRAAREN